MKKSKNVSLTSSLIAMALVGMASPTFAATEYRYSCSGVCIVFKSGTENLSVRSIHSLPQGQSNYSKAYALQILGLGCQQFADQSGENSSALVVGTLKDLTTVNEKSVTDAKTTEGRKSNSLHSETILSQASIGFGEFAPKCEINSKVARSQVPDYLGSENLGF